MRWMISIAGETVSPALEQCGRLLCVETEAGRTTGVRTIELERGECLELIQTLRREDPDVLLCGALCSQLYCMLAGHGLDVRPFLCGDAEELLDLCIRCRPIPDEHVMPGCGELARRRYPYWTSWTLPPQPRGDRDGS